VPKYKSKTRSHPNVSDHQPGSVVDLIANYYSITLNTKQQIYMYDVNFAEEGIQTQHDQTVAMVKCKKLYNFLGRYIRCSNLLFSMKDVPEWSEKINFNDQSKTLFFERRAILDLNSFSK
jgi:hypothetical protein